MAEKINQTYFDKLLLTDEMQIICPQTNLHVIFDVKVHSSQLPSDSRYGSRPAGGTHLPPAVSGGGGRQAHSGTQVTLEVYA